MVIEAVHASAEDAPVREHEKNRPEADAPVRLPAATGQRRAAAINAWLVAGLAFWAVVDSLIYGTLDGFLFTAPFMLVFGWAAYQLHGGSTAPRRNMLRHSGWMALALAGLCAISLVASVAATPVDVACALWSGGMVAGFSYAAWYQLRSPDSGRMDESAIERFN
jgi:hypothetical protein